MRKAPNTKKIGIFTLGGIILFIAILGVALGNKLFIKQSELVVFYFEESIKGLNVGSPVVFKGVNIGKVTSISLEIDPTSESFQIPVVAELKGFYDHEEFKNADNSDILKYFINEGLRARLASSNMLTGQLMIELEFLPNVPAVYRGPDENNDLEMPTTLSQLGAIAKDINQIPIAETVRRLDTLLEHINKDIPVVMKNLVQFSSDLNNPTVTEGSLISNMNSAVVNINKAAKSLRVFSDYIERNPQALLIGKGR